MNLDELAVFRKQGKTPSKTVFLSLVGFISSQSFVIYLTKNDIDFRSLLGLSVVIFTNSRGCRFAVDLSAKILDQVYLEDLSINNIDEKISIHVITNGEKDIRRGAFF